MQSLQDPFRGGTLSTNLHHLVHNTLRSENRHYATKIKFLEQRPKSMYNALYNYVMTTSHTPVEPS